MKQGSFDSSLLGTTVYNTVSSSCVFSFIVMGSTTVLEGISIFIDCCFCYFSSGGLLFFNVFFSSCAWYSYLRKEGPANDEEIWYENIARTNKPSVSTKTWCFLVLIVSTVVGMFLCRIFVRTCARAWWPQPAEEMASNSTLQPVRHNSLETLISSEADGLVPPQSPESLANIGKYIGLSVYALLWMATEYK